MVEMTKTNQVMMKKMDGTVDTNSLSHVKELNLEIQIILRESFAELLLLPNVSRKPTKSTGSWTSGVLSSSFQQLLYASLRKTLLMASVSVTVLPL